MKFDFHLDVADATAWLEGLPAGEVDLIVTDPAYASLEKHRAKGTTTRLKVSDGSSNPWFPIFGNERYEAFFAACYRALASNAHLYVMCDEETLDIVKPIGRAVGFTYWKAIVWDKARIGMGYHYRNQHEFVAFFEKGKRRLNDLGIPSVLRVPSVRGGFPTEKPVELLRILIEQSSSPGQVVVDPFLGSGATGAAAITAAGGPRVFAGCDIEAATVAAAQARLGRIGEPPFG